MSETELNLQSSSLNLSGERSDKYSKDLEALGKLTQEKPFKNNASDFIATTFSGFVPGLTVALGIWGISSKSGGEKIKISDIWKAIIPGLILFFYYSVKRIYYGRRIKLGNITAYLVGAALSLLVVVIAINDNKDKFEDDENLVIISLILGIPSSSYLTYLIFRTTRKFLKNRSGV